jgi:sugar lactone lactonase YvrE
MRRLLLLGLLLCASPAAAQPGPPWAIPDGNLRTPIGLTALADRFPDSATLVRRMLSAAHQTGDSARVLAGLERLAALGYAPNAETLELLSPHVPRTEMETLRDVFEFNRAPISASRVVTRIPAEHRLVEGLAWDARGRRLFAGTVVGRALLVESDGAWRTVDGIDAGSLFGLAIDEERQLLWLASGRVEQTPSPDTAFRGLIALDLRDQSVSRRVPLEGEGSPADLALGADGTVYASDPATGAVYRAAPDAQTLSVLVQPGMMANPQGLVVSADGRRLFVADYLHGIAMVELADGSVSRLPSDAGSMLDGIDGLVAHDGALLAIQNGTGPRRILRLRLDEAGSRITRVDVLERANPEWGEPTLGTLRDGAFVYVADAQWERYGEGGAGRGEGLPRATAIRALDP